MYGSTDDVDVDSNKALKPDAIAEESYIEHRRNVATITVGDSKVAVPTVSHVQEMVKDISTLDRHVKQLTAENRRMRTFINKMVAQMTKMQNALDNKMDKL
jgi:chaperonin cofactor prefoldin